MGIAKENSIVVTEFKIQIRMEQVFALIECKPESPIYEEVVEEFKENIVKIYEEIDPIGVILFHGEQAEVLTSIGKKIEKLSTQYFDEGDYLLGMMVDAMADDYLFQMDDYMYEVLKVACAQREVGILKRLFVPEDLSLETQKEILERMKECVPLSIQVTSGYMFDPIKTLSTIYMLTQDKTIFEGQHHCKKCKAINCKMRKGDCEIVENEIVENEIVDIEVVGVTVEVIRGAETFQVNCKQGESLLQSLISSGVYFSAACGGNGSCGKCKVQFISNIPEATKADQKVFTQVEIEEGWRLSCRVFLKDDATIHLLVGDESDFSIIADYGQPTQPQGNEDESSYYIGIDIGTTTIALHLIGAKNHGIIHTVTTINKQRAYGGDVISRIQASVDGKKEELQKSIQKDLLEGIKQLVQEGNIDASAVTQVAIGGNTTMGHLLMGYSCETLGLYPFTPVNIETIRGHFHEILGSDYLEASVILLPGISTYVGGDITAGLLICEFDQLEKPSLLIDLGTNGEMALGNKEKIFVTSTAAGPAFEGGNISCGMGSVQGAICNVEIVDQSIHLTTIGDKPPIGLCGTGVIESVSELLKQELIDETGMLEEEYFEEGYELTKTPKGKSIRFTQRDIREIQLAKSAVRAGVETLLLRYGIGCDEVEHVFLAGGFGYKINLEKAVHIGLLPASLQDKIQTVGNSSLAGAVQYLTDPKAEDRMRDILGVSKEIELSTDKDFNNFYMEHMYF